MRYHISTQPILDAFNKECSCPFCEIEKEVEKNNCEELLGDACMDDRIRTIVNEKGFCAHHYDYLFTMPSKLGLALQTDTRMNTLLSKMNKPKNARSAKKLSATINKELSTCIVCDFIEEQMVKYYKTTAQLFFNEEQFHPILKSSGGFCLRHYAKLLQYADSAGIKQKFYLECLYEVEKNALDKTQENIKKFSRHHDYRYRHLPLGDAEKALPDAREKLYGKKN